MKINVIIDEKSNVIGCATVGNLEGAVEVEVDDDFDCEYFGYNCNNYKLIDGELAEDTDLAKTVAVNSAKQTKLGEINVAISAAKTEGVDVAFDGETFTYKTAGEHAQAAAQAILLGGSYNYPCVDAVGVEHTMALSAEDLKKVLSAGLTKLNNIQKQEATLNNAVNSAASIKDVNKIEVIVTNTK